MSALVHQAASVTPPVMGRNVWVVSGTASSQRVAIPTAWRNAYITVKAKGDDFRVAFGTSAVAASTSNESTVASEAFSAIGSCSDQILNGNKEDYDMRQISLDVTHFAWIGTGTSGDLIITRSSGRVSAD